MTGVRYRTSATKFAAYYFCYWSCNDTFLLAVVGVLIMCYAAPNHIVIVDHHPGMADALAELVKSTTNLEVVALDQVPPTFEPVIREAPIAIVVYVDKFVLDGIKATRTAKVRIGGSRPLLIGYTCDREILTLASASGVCDYVMRAPEQLLDLTALLISLAEPTAKVRPLISDLDLLA